MSEREWTAEEQAVIVAARAYFEAIAACEQAGGKSNDAILAAMPAEVRAEMPILGALGL